MRMIDADELKTAFPICDNSKPILVASVRATIDHMPTITPPNWASRVEHFKRIARQNPYIRNPLAWALYSTWKEFDT